MIYSAEELTSYLETIDILVLTTTYRNKLDAPIAVEEILKALKLLQTGKTLGADRIPVEFYKTYAADLAPRLHTVYTKSTEIGELHGGSSHCGDP